MNKATFLTFFAFAAGAILFFSCTKDDYQSIEELDNENILAYIQRNNLNVQQYKNTDLYYEIVEPGTGRAINFNERYPVILRGSTLDGSYTSDTLAYGNRFYNFFGYFLPPAPTSTTAITADMYERTDDFKAVVREILQNADGTIRIIVPSRLIAGAREGNRTLGIPPNASMDYVVKVIDDLAEYEDGVIRSMIRREGLNVADFTKTSDNIYYRILEQGTGDVITRDSTVNVNYTLKFSNGSVSETGTDQSFTISSLVNAWGEIVPLLNKGGKVRFFTPSTMAYGANGSIDQTYGTVIMAPYMTLDFEVEVLND